MALCIPCFHKKKKYVLDQTLNGKIQQGLYDEPEEPHIYSQPQNTGGAGKTQVITRLSNGDSGQESGSSREASSKSDIVLNTQKTNTYEQIDINTTVENLDAKNAQNKTNNSENTEEEAIYNNDQELEKAEQKTDESERAKTENNAQTERIEPEKTVEIQITDVEGGEVSKYEQIENVQEKTDTLERDEEKTRKTENSGDETDKIEGNEESTNKTDDKSDNIKLGEEKTHKTEHSGDETGKMEGNEEKTNKTDDKTENLKLGEEKTRKTENLGDETEKIEVNEENTNKTDDKTDNIKLGEEKMHKTDNPSEKTHKPENADKRKNSRKSSELEMSSTESLEDKPKKPTKSNESKKNKKQKGKSKAPLPKSSSTENLDQGRRVGIVPLPAPINKPDKKIPVHPKDEKEEELIKSAIQKNEFLNKIIKGDLLDQVVKAMYGRDISAKEKIIKEGEKGQHLYVSAKGKYEISIKGKVVSSFEDVQVFGELAILYNAKRKATIKALKAGKVWVLDNDIYQQLMVLCNIGEENQVLEFLQNVPILNTVGNEVLQKVASLLRPKFYNTGEQIVKEGDRGDRFYIISAGTVTITKAKEGVVSVFKKGQFFGELAILSKEDRRQATVTADAPGVECLELTRQHFIEHFGDVREIPRAIESFTAETKLSIREEYTDITLKELQIIKTLGIGGFGRVELVQSKADSNQAFALKYLKKIDMLQQNQEEHVYNEKNIQMGCHSIFIVRLYRTFKDRKYLYFLMEFCPGGDLFALLHKQPKHRFDEGDARFITASVTEALDYLHKNNLIFRDLKPENILIDANGYFKITDFGFAKNLTNRGKTFTFAGTPEYIAPEIVKHKGHDKAADHWALGILIFELLTGRTPFKTNDPNHISTYSRILEGIDVIIFPSHLSHRAANIIGKLCRQMPSDRLGCQILGKDEIRNHKWFLGFQWDRLQQGLLRSPFRPKLRGPIDTVVTENFKKDDDIPEDDTSGWDNGF